MTLLSRRKLRTTARRITPATLAANIAAVLALCAAPAIAQPPSYSPPNYSPQGYSPSNQQPGYPPANAQPGYPPANTQPQGYPPNYQPQGYQPLNYQGSSANLPGANQPTNQKPGMLPLPPGYRPRPVPSQQRPASTTPTASAGGGTVMYFQKPADALTATGGDGSTVGAVAQANVPERGPGAAMPDAIASTLPPPPPPPPTSRYFPANTALNPPPAVVIPPVTPVSNEQPNPQPAPVFQPAPVQPTEPIAQPFTAQKKANPIPPVPEEYIKLPARENVFLVYDNLQLEKAIMERLRDDLKKDKKYSPDQERYLVFPPLPIISPPGVAYQAKTATYAPKQAALEPNYLVHRRLYFEEKNAERTGWDMGPLQVLVSAGYFWRDTLLVPQTMASGCVYGFWDTSAGKCFPGSPSPYFLYPPGLTVTGTVAEGVVVTGLSFIFH